MKLKVSTSPYTYFLLLMTIMDTGYFVLLNIPGLRDTGYMRIGFLIIATLLAMNCYINKNIYDQGILTEWYGNLFFHEKPIQICCFDEGENFHFDHNVFCIPQETDLRRSTTSSESAPKSSAIVVSGVILSSS